MVDYTRSPPQCMEMRLESDGSISRCIHYAPYHDIFCCEHAPYLRTNVCTNDIVEKINNSILMMKQATNIKDMKNVLWNYFALKQEFQEKYCDTEFHIKDMRSS